MRPSTPTLAMVLTLSACANGEARPGAVVEPDSGSTLIFAGQEGGIDIDAAVNDEGCPIAATLVYVTGDGAKLYSFYPPTLTFTLIGQLSCLASPTHMTVDRQGTAWIVAGGQIYTASTKDAACAPLASWKPDAGYFDFSLTFIGTGNTPDNTIYLLNNAVTLVTFDIMTGIRTPVGPAITIPSTQGDMTSSGDGNLYFLRDDTNLTLYEINPKTAAVIKQQDVEASGQGDQALAFWGGSFYAFENNVIYQYDPVKQTTVNIGSAPIQVSGAGQSTCVPKTYPTK